MQSSRRQKETASIVSVAGNLIPFCYSQCSNLTDYQITVLLFLGQCLSSFVLVGLFLFILCCMVYLLLFTYFLLVFFLGWGGRGQENLFHNRIYYLYISIGKRINAISYKIWRELVLFLIASNSLLIVDSLNCFN